MAFSEFPPDRRESWRAPGATNGPSDEASKLELAQTYIGELGDWLVERAQDLAARPDKCKFIRKMTLDLECNYVLPHWVWSQLNGLNHNHELVESRARQPAMRSLFQILPLATQLQSLVLKHLIFDMPAAESLCKLECLQALTLDACLFVDSVAERVRSPGHGLALHVPNVHLHFSESTRNAGQEQWRVLCFCPSVLNLSLIRDESGPILPLQRIYRTWAMSFGQLQRLYIRSSTDPTGDRLGPWVDSWRNANPNQEPALTHLKWELPTAWSSEEVMPPLRKLLSPNVKVLCVDGLPCDMANRSTIELIRAHAPNLQALTLSARENENQHRMRPMLWAEPSWGYADVVGSFPCLEHFEWNYRIPTQQATPALLLAMEKYELERSSEEDVSPYFVTEPLDFEDHYLAAAPFAASSSSLKTWVASRGAEWAIDEVVCLIQRHPMKSGRTPDQGVLGGAFISHAHARQVPALAQWDVDSLADYPSWPNISPKQAR
jgi:hypothetical protein